MRIGGTLGIIVGLGLAATGARAGWRFGVTTGVNENLAGTGIRAVDEPGESPAFAVDLDQLPGDLVIGQDIGGGEDADGGPWSARLPPEQMTALNALLGPMGLRLAQAGGALQILVSTGAPVAFYFHNLSPDAPAVTVQGGLGYVLRDSPGYLVKRFEFHTPSEHLVAGGEAETRAANTLNDLYGNVEGFKVEATGQ